MLNQIPTNIFCIIGKIVIVTNLIWNYVSNVFVVLKQFYAPYLIFKKCMQYTFINVMIQTYTDTLYVAM